VDDVRAEQLRESVRELRESIAKEKADASFPDYPQEGDFYSYSLDKVRLRGMAITARALVREQPRLAEALIYYALEAAAFPPQADELPELFGRIESLAYLAVYELLGEGPAIRARRCSYIFDVTKYRLNGGDKPRFDADLWKTKDNNQNKEEIDDGK